MQGTDTARLNPNLRPDTGHAVTGKWLKARLSEKGLGCFFKWRSNMLTSLKFIVFFKSHFI